jgi:signal transduction histidine kinase
MEPVDGNAREVSRQSNLPGRRRAALIVDGCATSQAALRDLLASEYECEAAGTVEEAMAAASHRTPDLIISDSVLKNTNGYELCRRIRTDPRWQDIPLIVLTSSSDPDARATALEEGADDCLCRPFRPRELLARVRALMRLRDARQEVLRHNHALERAHEGLLQAQLQLLEAERLATMGTIAAGLAHVINNPLSVVWAGFDHLLDSVQRTVGQSAACRAEVVEEVGEIRAEVRGGLERIRSIVQQLAALGAPEDHRRVSVSVHEEIDRAVGIANARLGRVELKRRFEGPPEIRATPGYLTQIVAQVLINAADAVAAQPQPRIEVRTRRTEAGLEIVIEDNGKGIAVELIPQIFDPFFTTKAAGVGSGLGLALCQRLIQRLGGSVQVASQAGRGTQVLFCVPFQAPSVDLSLRPRPEPRFGSREAAGR